MIDEGIAKAILNQLTSGTVHFAHSSLYNVGREKQLNVVEKEISNGTSRLRFINGDYGTGKTHFLSCIRNWAILNGFASSHVILSPRETPLHNLKAVYSRILKNIFLDPATDSYSPMQSILEFVYKEFQSWLQVAVKQADLRCEKAQSMRALFCEHCHKTGAIEKLYIKDFDELDRRLQIAITIYRHSRWGYNPDFETADLVIRWIEGEPLYRRDLNYLGVWESLVEQDILRGLNEIAKLIALLNKRGLVIMLDEAEGIENLPANQIPIAYNNLNFLIKGAKKIHNVYFLYATTPTFFNSASIYSSEITELLNKTHQTDLSPLTLGDFIKLADLITTIFRTATGYSQDRSMPSIDDFIITATERSLSPRTFITNLLDLLNSNSANAGIS